MIKESAQVAEFTIKYWNEWLFLQVIFKLNRIKNDFYNEKMNTIKNK